MDHKGTLGSKGITRLKMLSYKIQSADLKLKSIEWFPRGEVVFHWLHKSFKNYDFNHPWTLILLENATRIAPTLTDRFYYFTI